MNELTKIITAYQQTDFSLCKAALATVIRVTGSSYRGPGARMYITDDGKWYGSISGGCLEGDALRKSRAVMQSNQATMITYDTMDDDNPELGVGLGCNGIIHVLLEPICTHDNPLDLLIKLHKQDNISALATIYESEIDDTPVAQRLSLLDRDIGLRIEASAIEQLITQELNQLLVHKKSYTKTFEIDNKTCSVFLEVIEPPIHLMIFGGGYDAQPLTTIAKTLGWEVTVIDECPAHLIPVNFPQAQLTSCHRTSVGEHAPPKPYSAAVLLSHNYYYDLEVMQQLMTTDIRYIGLLGPQKKGDKIKKDLISKGVVWDKQENHRVHYPIGIDIGADTPEEIALAIVAEIKAKFSGRSAGFLKYKSGSIHDKHPKSGEVFKQVYVHPSKTVIKHA